MVIKLNQMLMVSTGFLCLVNSLFSLIQPSFLINLSLIITYPILNLRPQFYPDEFGKQSFTNKAYGTFSVLFPIFCLLLNAQIYSLFSIFFVFLIALLFDWHYLFYSVLGGLVYWALMTF